MVLIDLKALYGETARLALLPEYLEQTLRLTGEGHAIVLTGAAPVWLYLKVAYALHGKARKLLYRSPVTGDVVIFDHDPFGKKVRIYESGQKLAPVEMQVRVSKRCASLTGRQWTRTSVRLWSCSVIRQVSTTQCILHRWQMRHSLGQWNRRRIDGS